MSVLLLLLLGSVACDVAGQLLFKVGTVKAGADAGLAQLVVSPWIAGGIAVYALEFVLWFAALSRAPLAMAVPFMALGYVGIVLASRVVLGERVSPRRWFATLLISGGVALACWPAP
jgi:drug/metabolite transporter (DMT)-like permease